jgi:hypothetical protein
MPEVICNTSALQYLHQLILAGPPARTLRPRDRARGGRGGGRRRQSPWRRSARPGCAAVDERSNFIWMRARGQVC